MNGCGKDLGYRSSETGEIRICGDEVFVGKKHGLIVILCKECRLLQKGVKKK